MQKSATEIVVFLVIASVLILALISFVIAILYLYRKRQQFFENSIEQLKLDQEKIKLTAQVEMQEQAFTHISREIHDNISLALVLANLNLNTLCNNHKDINIENVNTTMDLITRTISDLRDLSKGLNGDIIIQQGLIEALKLEISRIEKIGLFNIHFSIIGNSLFLQSNTELIIFRIIQEGFNNIIKHAQANNIKLILTFNDNQLFVELSDDGIGFNKSQKRNGQAGLTNMKTRVSLLRGHLKIDSEIEKGTVINFSIPIINPHE
jgi:two-component system NarL family sensor kinase